MHLVFTFPYLVYFALRSHFVLKWKEGISKRRTNCSIQISKRKSIFSNWMFDLKSIEQRWKELNCRWRQHPLKRERKLNNQRSLARWSRSKDQPSRSALRMLWVRTTVPVPPGKLIVDASVPPRFWLSIVLCFVGVNQTPAIDARWLPGGRGSARLGKRRRPGRAWSRRSVRTHVWEAEVSSIQN